MVFTSSDEESDIIASYDLVCNSYMRKPVDFSELVKATGQLGLYWILTNRPMPKKGKI